MWKLTIEDDEGQRTTLELEADDYTIGRADDASIRLTEQNVSRRHAVLRADAERGWAVEDGPSYNGTYVNGERVVVSRALQSGDVVQLGDYRLELLDEKVSTRVRDAGRRKTRPDRLVVIVGPAPGTEFPLEGERLTAGRSEEADLSINHASVSRMHGEFVALGQGRWEVIDSGSANGLRINGVDLKRGIIEPGDTLELGDVRLRYVAAGKYLRPGSEPNQTLPAMVEVDDPDGRSAPRMSIRPAVIGTALGLLGLAIVWWSMQPTRRTDTAVRGTSSAGAPPAAVVGATASPMGEVLPSPTASAPVVATAIATVVAPEQARPSSVSARPATPAARPASRPPAPLPSKPLKMRTSFEPDGL